MKLLFSFIILYFSIAIGHAQEPMRLDIHPEKLTVYDRSEQIAQFDIEVAQTEAERSAGLMYRTDLPQDRGMLFVFNGAAVRFFWMQNTPTPLDIIYAAGDGTIVHIAGNTTPFSTDPIPSRSPAQYAFEIHAGLSKMLGIKAGQTLRHPVIQDAQ